MAKLNQSTAQRVAALLIRSGVPFEFKRDTNGGLWINAARTTCSAAAVERAIDIVCNVQALEAQPLELH